MHSPLPTRRTRPRLQPAPRLRPPTAPRRVHLGTSIKLNTTVNGLDQYHQISDVEVPFRGSPGHLLKDAKDQPDTMASSLAGHKGYIIELEAHAPGAGATGIQN